MTTRFGIGYDAHALEAGMPLTLGGVRIPSERGLAGHSDGDVVAHAIIDALLGAAALGDIGTHFKADDPSVPQGVTSTSLLERTVAMLRRAGWSVVNVDATIVLQRPHLSEYVPAMRWAIAASLGVGLSAVSIKATTEDGLGYTGSETGAAAMAVASITDGNS